MRNLEDFLEKLGIEKGETFLATDGLYYKVESGQMHMCDREWLFASVEKHIQLISGEIKPVWKPKLGGFYWTIEFDEEDKVYQYMWHNEEADQRLLERGVVFETKEEAIATANKMLEAIKEED